VKVITGPDPMLAGEAARALGIRAETLARWRKAGKITGTQRHTGRYTYARAEVERVLNGIPALAPRALDTGKPECGAIAPGPEPYVCTAAEGHEGDHVAYGVSGRVVADWEA
jgi:hypothetical protein